MNPLRIGIIGTGGISNFHGEMIETLEDAVITALADPNELNRNKFKAKFDLTDVKEYTDYRDLLNEGFADAVIICSPHSMHYEHAAAALQSGHHVLLEKPMTVRVEEAEKLEEAAKASGKVLQIGYQRLFMPEFVYIKQVLDSGKLGKLTSLTACLYQNWEQLTIGTWRQIPELSGGGTLFDSGSHALAAILWLTGLEPLQAKAISDFRGTPVEINTYSVVRFSEGVIAGINIIGNAADWFETYTLCGEKGVLHYDNGKVILHMHGEEPAIVEQEYLPSLTRNQAGSFVDAVRGKGEVRVAGDFGREVIRFTKMIYAAAGTEDQ